MYIKHPNAATTIEHPCDQRRGWINDEDNTDVRATRMIRTQPVCKHNNTSVILRTDGETGSGCQKPHGDTEAAYKELYIFNSKKEQYYQLSYPNNRFQRTIRARRPREHGGTASNLGSYRFRNRPLTPEEEFEAKQPYRPTHEDVCSCIREINETLRILVNLGV